MRAYPAAYRRERGDEIIATLLEATPEGRKRPLLRDMRALIVGGFRARAAQNRHFTTAVNLRLAVLAGFCIYLAAAAAADLDTFFNSELDRGVLVGRIGWPALVAGLLIGAVVALTWLARRAVVIAAVALPAAAAAGYVGVSSVELGFVVTQLVCLAAVVALTVRAVEHRSPAWLWLIGAVVAALFVPGYLQYRHLSLVVVHRARSGARRSRRRHCLGRHRRAATSRVSHFPCAVVAAPDAGKPCRGCR